MNIVADLLYSKIMARLKDKEENQRALPTLLRLVYVHLRYCQEFPEFYFYLSPLKRSSIKDITPSRQHNS